jgi:dTDP-4-amino-4,6-dideoxygalactose transaminase
MAGEDTGDTVRVPFCKPDYCAREWDNLQAAIAQGRLEGGGRFTRACEARLEAMTGAQRALIVPSCTAALEMMALIAGIGPGDEVIMPDYTFVSTANAIALRGGVPVFVDVDPLTLNICPAAVKTAITERTRAVMVVHYAGVSCDMDAISQLCQAHGLMLMEDAAQALSSSWKGQALGTFGRFGAISFHHTKNVSCGEGGALLINDPDSVQIAEHVRDKGTDRAEFLRGQRAKYEWQTLGSSFLLSELAAAVLEGQLYRADDLRAKRLVLWDRYLDAFAGRPELQLPRIPDGTDHNGHIFHLRFERGEDRDGFVQHMRQAGIIAAPHYIALHGTPGGQRFARSAGRLDTSLAAERTLVRLPLFSAMTPAEQDFVIAAAFEALDQLR